MKQINLHKIKFLLFMALSITHSLSMAQSSYDKKINEDQKIFLTLIQMTQQIVSNELIDEIVKNSCKNYNELKSKAGLTYNSFTDEIKKIRDTLIAKTTTPQELKKYDSEFNKMSNEIYDMTKINPKNIHLSSIPKISKTRKEKILFIIKSLAWSSFLRIETFARGYKVEIANIMKNVIYPDLTLIVTTHQI